MKVTHERQQAKKKRRKKAGAPAITKQKPSAAAVAAHLSTLKTDSDRILQRVLLHAGASAYTYSLVGRRVAKTRSKTFSELWSAAFGSITDHQRTLGLPLLYGIGFVVPALGLHLVSQQLIIALGGEPTSQEAVEMVARASAPPELALQALSVVVFAPVCEELLFRGVLYPSLRDLGHRRMAIAASSLLFAAIHGSLALMLPLTVLAVVLVWLYEKTGSIIAPILMHAAFNAINFAMIKLIPQIAQ